MNFKITTLFVLLNTFVMGQMVNDHELRINVCNPDSLPLCDKAIIAFNSLATDSFDPVFDGNKLGGDPDRLSLYSINNGLPLNRNTLNSVLTTDSVIVGFRSGISNNFIMSFDSLETFDTTTEISVKDTKLNIFHDPRSGNYSFTGQESDSANRFIVYFKNHPIDTDTISIDTITSIDYITFEKEPTETYNLMGQRIYTPYSDRIVILFYVRIHKYKIISK